MSGMMRVTKKRTETKEFKRIGGMNDQYTQLQLQLQLQLFYSPTPKKESIQTKDAIQWMEDLQYER